MRKEVGVLENHTDPALIRGLIYSGTTIEESLPCQTD
jgi:hypothetical protein